MSRYQRYRRNEKIKEKIRRYLPYAVGAAVIVGGTAYLLSRNNQLSKIDDPIIRKNLAKMTSSNEGGMLSLKFAREIREKGVRGSCAVAHFYYDQRGEIKSFGYQGNSPASFTLGINSDGRYRMNSTFFGSGKPTDLARENLERTARAYNERYGFRGE